MTKISRPQHGEDSTTVQSAKENPGKPTEAARNPQTEDIQKDWNSGHPGGVATIEDPPNSLLRTRIRSPRPTRLIPARLPCDTAHVIA